MKIVLIGIILNAVKRIPASTIKSIIKGIIVFFFNNRRLVRFNLWDWN
ncbi:hypothetical protein SDC9_206545 [bioreactor metagenome]|uniref:Uncharacterized protein n=1 Tax=bioreactor metagenome TaxID=1076179 RepID=A0A645J6R9_9ZZZZ